MTDISYETFNRHRADLGMKMVEIEGYPFNKKKTSWMNRFLRGRNQEPITPWWDEFKLLEMEDKHGCRFDVLIQFDRFDHDRCSVYLNVPGDIGTFKLLSGALRS